MSISDERLAYLVSSMDAEHQETESPRFADVAAALRELQEARQRINHLCERLEISQIRLKNMRDRYNPEQD